MTYVLRKCVDINGTIVYQNITKSDAPTPWESHHFGNVSDQLSSVFTSDNVTAATSSYSSTSWEAMFEQQLGPNVTCMTQAPELPSLMRFTQDTLVSVIAYSCMFLVAAIGNIIVLTTLWSSRKNSRVNLCILNLSIADLFVAFIFLPLETTWHITVSWRAGDFACRIFMLLRAFGFYLSSFILMVISLDRYFSIVHPLTICDAHNRCKVMLCVAWAASFISSLPQSFIFHVERHPVFTWYKQCVTFNSFPSRTHELAYNLFNFVAVYLLPLIVITICYILIFAEVSRQKAKHEMAARPYQLRVPLVRYLGSRGSVNRSLIHSRSTASTVVEMRCSTSSNLTKAKVRTARMTLVIVSVFLLCWTPYFSILCFYWFAKEEAEQVDQKIQRILFMFAVSNACFDPIIYGMFTATFRRKAKLWKQIIHKKLSKLTFSTVA